jgi:hypothetical protein
MASSAKVFAVIPKNSVSVLNPEFMSPQKITA